MVEATSVNGPGSGWADRGVLHQSEQATQSSSLYPQNRNILELPKASEDFVGYWGGSIQSTIQRFDPDFTGTSPERVSVVFGRNDRTVFMASELYSSVNQTIVRRPRARLAGARVAIVEYRAADRNFYYICSHRFQLIATTIAYQSRTDVYERDSHRLLGIVVGRATLKPLLTADEQLQFARPTPLEIPRTEISASAGLVPP
jgi:hypothetical protein